MRIGELLLERGILRQSDLARALDDQAGSGRRLCSLLIVRGAIDFDDAARALADHRGVPCALAKHLSNRDPALATLIPAELGRASCALPIGRASTGNLIIAVRDPERALLAALRQATRKEVTMVVTPATRLEQLISTSYGASPNDEFDVDLSSSVDLPVPPSAPPAPDVDLLDPDSVRLALSDLDDARVAKDPSQSGSQVAPFSSPAVPRTASKLPPAAPSLQATRANLDRATTKDGATELVIAYVAGRWRCGFVAILRDQRIEVYQGHGVSPNELPLPLGSPSTIERAVTSKLPSTELPAGPVQDQLARMLGAPSMITAVPVLVAGQVVAVIVGGDSLHGGDAKAGVELAQLGLALGSTYERIGRR